MLSRVADSLYWMSRYLERAEHTARLLSVQQRMMVDMPLEETRDSWVRMLAALNVPPQEQGVFVDTYDMTRRLTVDRGFGPSIAACITNGRDNARQAREAISSEMWQQLNREYLELRTTRFEDIWDSESIDFFTSTKESIQLFNGITDATMSHGEGWHFIQLGRFIERTQLVSGLLTMYYGGPAPGLTPVDNPPSYYDWANLLKMCTAFEAYCKAHTAEIIPSRIAEFLIFDPEFPRSLRFSVDMIATHLGGITPAGGRAAGRAQRLAGRLRSTLDFGQVDEIPDDDMAAYLTDIRTRGSEIHGAISETYVYYPVDAYIAS